MTPGMSSTTMRLGGIPTTDLRLTIERFDAFRAQHPEADDDTSEATFRSGEGKLVATIAQIRNELTIREN